MLNIEAACSSLPNRFKDSHLEVIVLVETARPASMRIAHRGFGLWAGKRELEQSQQTPELLETGWLGAMEGAWSFHNSGNYAGLSSGKGVRGRLYKGQRALGSKSGIQDDRWKIQNRASLEPCRQGFIRAGTKLRVSPATRKAEKGSWQLLKAAA